MMMMMRMASCGYYRHSTVGLFKARVPAYSRKCSRSRGRRGATPWRCRSPVEEKEEEEEESEHRWECWRSVSIIESERTVHISGEHLCGALNKTSSINLLMVLYPMFLRVSSLRIWYISIVLLPIDCMLASVTDEPCVIWRVTCRKGNQRARVQSHVSRFTNK